MFLPSLKKFKLLLPNFGFRAFVITAGSLWLLTLVLGYVARVSDYLAAPLWVSSGLRLLAYVFGILLVLLVVYRLWGLLLRFALFLWSLVTETEAVEFGFDSPVKVEEAPAIVQTIDDLTQILNQIETDSRQARLLLADAETYALALVELVQAVSLRAEAMFEETEGLNQALEALAAGDPLKIAMAAGAVKDTHIRTLLISEVKHADYWHSVARLIAVQLGTLQQWEQGYRRFAANLLTEVSQAKSRLAALQASNELIGASRPLLQIQTNLNQAGQHLQLERTPGLTQIGQMLPSVKAGLLR